LNIPMIGLLGIKRCPILDNFGKKGEGPAVLALAPTAVPGRETALYILFMVVSRMFVR
jgi:hypothetical protein